VPGPARRNRRAVPGREGRHAGLARARHGANSRHGLGPVKIEAQPNYPPGYKYPSVRRSHALTLALLSPLSRPQPQPLALCGSAPLPGATEATANRHRTTPRGSPSDLPNPTSPLLILSLAFLLSPNPNPNPPSVRRSGQDLSIVPSSATLVLRRLRR
jgi:hypothetical protein